MWVKVFRFICLAPFCSELPSRKFLVAYQSLAETLIFIFNKDFFSRQMSYCLGVEGVISAQRQRARHDSEIDFFSKHSRMIAKMIENILVGVM